MSAEYSVEWPSPSERNPHRTMRGEFCSLLSDLQREWMKDGAADGSAAIDAAYEALHQFVSRLATHPHSPDAADSGRVDGETVGVRLSDLRNLKKYLLGATPTLSGNTSWGEWVELRLERAALAAQGQGNALERCDTCDGEGEIYAPSESSREACPNCDGSGIIAPPASPAVVPDDDVRWLLAQLRHNEFSHDYIKDERRCDACKRIKSIAAKLDAAPSATPEGAGGAG